MAAPAAPRFVQSRGGADASPDRHVAISNGAPNVSPTSQYRSVPQELAVTNETRADSQASAAPHAPSPVREDRHEPAKDKQVALIDDADFGGEYLFETPRDEGSTTSASSGLEADIALVDGYVGAPGTPAILRSEAVGEVLGIGEVRAERALERISERPDRLSRIRRGAYMVRGGRNAS